MRQFVHCNGCNSQVPTPESLDGKPSPQFLKCETCGNEFFWNGGLTDNSEPLILFSIEDSSESLEPTEILAIESCEESNSFVSGNETDPTGSDGNNENTYISNCDPENVDRTALVFTPDRTGLDNPESVERQFEEFARDELPSLEPEPFPLTQFAPPEVKEVQDELDSSPRTDQSPRDQNPPVPDTEPEPFELELEIESEWDMQSSESEAPHSPATEIATDHEESNPVIEPYYTTDLYEAAHPAQAQSIETTRAVELAATLESSPAVDWSVLGSAIPRRRPKEVSAIRKILPPVLGGLAAFPIATLILWYGFGKDIGTTGPTVAKYLPWIVPEKFRSMPFENSTPINANGRIASGRPQRSAPPARNTLPTLNRDEINAPIEDSSNASAPITVMEKPNVEPEYPTAPAQAKTNSTSESSVANISESIAALRLLQIEMRNAAKEGKTPIFVACQSKLRDLSKLAAELTGPSSRTWGKELEAISREILADLEIPRAMEKVANKARKEIPAAVSGDFVATVIKVGEANEVSTNETWTLREKWQTDDTANPIPIEVSPGALRAGSGTFPATCMVFGRLLPMDNSDSGASNNSSTGSGLVLKVHLLVPK